MKLPIVKFLFSAGIFPQFGFYSHLFLTEVRKDFNVL